jgi:hypothetical protein
MGAGAGLLLFLISSSFLNAFPSNLLLSRCLILALVFPYGAVFFDFFELV